MTSIVTARVHTRRPDTRARRDNRREDATRIRQRGIMRRSWRMAHNLKGAQP